MNATPEVLLGHHLKALRLPTFLREYDKVARQCAADGVDHVRYLLRLAELELIDRERRLVERRIRAARFPAVKSLDSFDFTALPSLNKTLVLELARCEYIGRRDNVIAVGNAGTGTPNNVTSCPVPHAYANPISPSATKTSINANRIARLNANDAGGRPSGGRATGLLSHQDSLSAASTNTSTPTE